MLVVLLLAHHELLQLLRSYIGKHLTELLARQLHECVLVLHERLPHLLFVDALIHIGLLLDLQDGHLVLIEHLLKLLRREVGYEGVDELLLLAQGMLLRHE